MRSWRICLLADYSGVLDEGMRKIAYHLNKELSKRHFVKPLPLSNALSPAFSMESEAFSLTLFITSPVHQS